MNNNKDLVSIGKAAEILGVSVDTLRRWEKEGLIQSIRPNGYTRYFSLNQLLEKKPAAPIRKSFKEQQTAALLGRAHHHSLAQRILAVGGTLVLLLLLGLSLYTLNSPNPAGYLRTKATSPKNSQVSLSFSNIDKLIDEHIASYLNDDKIKDLIRQIAQELPQDALNGEQGTQGLPGISGAKGATGDQGTQGPSGEIGPATCSYGACVSRQLTTPGTAEEGNFNLQGSGILGGNLTVSGTIYGSVAGTINPGFTTGSVIFQGASGLAQDNPNFFWNDTNNRLGIGTAIPSTLLEVFSSASAGGFGITLNSDDPLAASMYHSPSLQFNNTNDPGHAFTLRKRGAGTTSRLDIGSGGTPNSSSGTTRVSFLESGNVGIGTTVPGSLVHLFNSAPRLTLESSGSGGPTIILGTDNAAGTIAPSRFFIGSGSTSYLNINTSSSGTAGFVGIGTTIPFSLLDLGSATGNVLRINTPASDNSSLSSILFAVNGQATERAKISVISPATNQYALSFFTSAVAGSNLERMRIDQNGNVGIGITNPVFKLEVVDNSNPPVRFSRSAGGDILQLYASGGGLGNLPQLGFTVLDSGGSAGFTVARLSGVPTNLTSGAVTGGLRIQTRNAGTQVDAMEILANGNVGIGTTSPVGKFQIDNGSNITATIRLRENDVSNGFIETNYTDSTSGFSKWGMGTLTDSYSTTALQNSFYFFQYRDKTEAIVNQYRFLINDSGNVGIGTTNPISPLEVNGDIRITQGTSGQIVFADGSTMSTAGLGSASSLSNTTDVIITSDTDANNSGDIIFKTDSNERARILAAGGNFGIGTSTPTALLHVAGTALFQNAANSTTAFRVLNLAGTSIFNVDTTNGRVGIGTSTPNSALEVNGDIRITTASGGQIFFADGTSMSTAGVGSANALSNATDAIITGDSDANASGGILFKIGSVEYGRFTNAGNLGLGTITPVNKFDVNGNVAIGTYAGVNTAPANGLIVSGAVGFGTSSPAGAFQVVGGNSLFAANVGIGTNTPSSPLEVNGDIRITSGSGGQIVFADGSTMNTAGLGSASSLSNITDAVITGDSDANASGGILFKIGSNEFGRFSNGGNFGLGTTAPGTPLDIVSTTASGTVGRITTNNLTTGVALQLASTSTGLTSGSLLLVSSATTGLVSGNGIINFNATGNYTSSGNNGLLTVQANATTAGTIQNIAGNALTTGQALRIASTGTGLTSGSLLFVTSATTGAVATNGIVSLNATGNYSSSGTNTGLLNVLANATTAGTVQQISGNALTTGVGLAIKSTGTGLTSGSLLFVTTPTTGAVATNGIVSLQATGNYTSTSNVGLLNVLANTTTGGTIQNIQGNALTTGVALQLSSTGTGLTSGRLLNVSSATTAAVSNGIVSLNATGNYTSTANIGLLSVLANSTSTGTIQNIQGNGLTTGVGLHVSSNSINLSSGSLLFVTSATTTTLATNGIVSFNATGNYASSANVGLLNAVADATTAGTVARFSGAALTTGKVLQLTPSTTLTTGNALSISGATYVHSIAETGNLAQLVFTDASTATSGTTTTNGLAISMTDNAANNTAGGDVLNGINISSTINTTGATATKNINGINIASPTKTACTGGACTWTGINVADPGTLANTTFYAATFAGGNVGIGTTAPTTLLHVAGTALFQNTANSTTAFRVLNLAGTSIFNVDTTNGRVGIGTSTPASKLEVNGDIRITSGSGGALVFADGTSMTTAGGGGPVVGTADALSNITDAVITGDSDANGSGEILFKIGSTEYGRFTNSGNVGIGTSAPGAKLEIHGTTGGAFEAARFTETGPLGGAYISFVRSSDSTHGLIIGEQFSPVDKKSAFRACGNVSESICVQSGLNDSSVRGVLALNYGGGNVGIGTVTPAATLDVNGTTNGSGTLTQSAFKVRTTGTGAMTLLEATETSSVGTVYLANQAAIVRSNLGLDLTQSTGILRAISADQATLQPLQLQGSTLGLFTAGTQRVTVNSAGNVGIGTISPNTTLHVQQDQNAGTYIKVQNATAGTASTASFYALNNLGVGVALETLSSSLTNTGFPNIPNYGRLATDTALDGLIIRSGINDPILFGSGVTERMRLDANGNVGIGTTNPQRQLHLYKNDGSSSVVRIESGFTGTDAAVQFKTLNSAQWQAYVQDSSQSFRLHNGTLDTLTILPTSGNVGIGTTAPASKIEINGDIRITSGSGGSLYFADGTSMNTAGAGIPATDSLSGTGDVTITADSDANGSGGILFKIDGTEYGRFSNSGNLGIGTSTPSNKLQIAANGNARVQTTAYGTGNDSGLLVQWARGTQASPTTVTSGDRIGRLIFQGYDGASFINAADIQVAVDGTPGTNDMPGRLSFFTTPDGSTTITERMRIDNAGNVGIGTTNPGAKLSVAGTGSPTQVTVSSDSSFTEFVASFTSPSVVNTFGSVSTLGYFGTTTNHPIMLRTNNTERLRIDTSGNVGIGTTSPAAPLDVVGKFRVANSGNIQSLAGQVWQPFTDTTSALGIANAAGIPLLNFDTINNIVGLGTGATLGSTGGQALTIGGSTTGDILFAAGHNVGIGTTAPTSPLEVNGDIKITSGSGGQIVFADGSTMNSASLGSANALSNITDAIITGDSDANASGGILFKIGSTEYGRFANSGNFGIGTTSPLTKLHIVTDGLAGGQGITLDTYNNTGSTPNPSINARSARGTAAAPAATQNNDALFSLLGNGYDGTAFQSSADIFMSSAENWTTSARGAYMIFRTVAAGSTTKLERMRISSTGNVGIGNGAPAALFSVGSGSLFNVTSAGNVGIGTASPGFKLDLVGTDGVEAPIAISAAAAAPVLQMFRSNGTAASRTQTLANDIIFDIRGRGHTGTAFAGSPSVEIRGISTENVTSTTNGGALFFMTTANGSTAPLERMRIDPTGNVGIGTTAPTALLQVAGISLFKNASNSTSAFMIQNAGGSNIFNVDTTNSRVGINTASPLSAFEVNGDIRITNASGGQLFFADGTSMSTAGLGSASALSNTTDAIITGDSDANASGGILFKIGSTEYARFANGGNLGIGTTTPTANLDIVSTATTANVENITAASLTSGYALNLNVNGAAVLTSGGAINVVGPTGAAVISNTQGLVKISAAGAFTTTAGSGGLLDVIGNGTITGTLASISDSAVMTTTGNLLTLTANAATTTTGLFTINGSGLTTGYAQNINANGAAVLTSGGALNIVGPTGAAAISANSGLVKISAAGAFTTSTGAGSGGLLDVQANAVITGTLASISDTAVMTTTGNLLSLTANAATTTTGLVTTNSTGLTTGFNHALVMGTALTTGGALNITGASYNHPSTQTGSLASFSVTDASTATSGTTTTNGLNITLVDTAANNTAGSNVLNGINIASTINTTGATATKSINGINIASPTKTACTGGACTWTGISVADPGTLANTTFYAATFAGGNVGIGTTTPNALLNVNGDSGASFGTVNINQTGANDILTAGAGGTTKFKISNAGNIVSIAGAQWRPATDSTSALQIANSGGVSILNIDTSNNRVGIGTLTPNFQLSVLKSAAGTNVGTFSNIDTSDQATNSVLRLNIGTTTTGTATRFIQFFAGSTTDNDGTGVGAIRLNNGNVAYETGSADFAEYITVNEATEYGDIISIKESGEKGKAKSGESLLGVVSDTAGFVGNAKHDPAPGEVIVGLVGQVKTKVTTANGAIKAGDSIAASDTPGVGMKATRSGNIIGKALESFSSDGIGKILVYVNTSYADPTNALAKLSLDEGGNLVLPSSTVIASDEGARQSANGIASSSSTPRNDVNLLGLAERVASLEAKFSTSSNNNSYSSSEQDASREALLGSLVKDVDILKGQVLGASVSATLAQADVTLTNSQTASNSASVLDSLIVSGNTNLNNLGVTGTFTTGIIAMNGLEGEINTLGGPLKLQSTGLGPVELVGGKVSIDQQGDLKIAEGKIVGNDSFRGQAVLKAGQTELRVDKSWENQPQSLILTPTFKTTVWFERLDASGFTIKVDQAPSKDSAIHWMAIW